MKKLSLFTALLLQIISSFLFSQTGNEIEEKYKNYYPPFSISYPKPYYMPGDTVSLRVSAAWNEMPAVFTVKIYQIKDPELFYTSQASREVVSVVAKDSSNLNSLLEEKSSYEQTLYVNKKTNSKTKAISYSLDDYVKYIPNDYGAYIIRIYYKNRVSSVGFFVTSLGLLTRITSNSILNYAANRMNSAPVDGARVVLFLNGTKYGEGVTSGGTLNHVFSEEHKKIIRKYTNVYPYFMAIKDREVAVSDPYFYFYGNYQRFKAHIIINQPVYRPPAVVNFKVSIREFTQEGYAVFAGKNVVVSAADASKTKIYRKVLKTDENGSISDSLNIDEGAPLGNYNLSVQVVDEKEKDDAEDDVIQTFKQSFSVEEFKKPEYKIDIKTDKEQYSDGEKIQLEVQADYYFGNPLQNAEVKYDIYKKPLYRPWWYFSEYRWWYEQYYSANNKNFTGSSYVDHLEGKLDSKGHMVLPYPVKEDFKEKYNNKYSKDEFYETDYMYIFTVYVKDKSRQNVVQTKTVNVTRSDFFISSNTDKYVYKPGDKIGIVIRAADFSDKKVEANVNISVNRTVYEGKYPNKKKITSFVGNYSGKTSARGDETVFIDAADEGQYEIEIVSYDSKNKKISDKTNCMVSKGYMWWWDRDPGTVEIIPEKESYFPGDTCVALVMTAHENVNLLVTNYNGNIVSYWVEKIDGNSVYIKVPLNGNYSPNFFLNISYMTGGEVYTKSVSVPVIPINKFADITLTSDKPVYKPREEGTIDINIKDKFGKPLKNAEVTLGMIDESIYAIKSENVIDIKSAFYSPAADNTFSSFSRNNPLYYSVYSGFASLFEKTNYKQVPAEKLCNVHGKLVDFKGNPVRWAQIVIDKQYTAGSTNSLGEFGFSIPEGKYHIFVFIGNILYEGTVKLDTEGGNKYELEIKVYNGNIISAKLNGEYVNPQEVYIEENKGEGNCKLTGTVKDLKDNNPLIGAVISVEGTTLKTSTDEKGNYTILNVPVGTYTVKCIYIGYDSQTITGVVVTSEKIPAIVDFSMSLGGGIMMDTVIINDDMLKNIDKEESKKLYNANVLLDEIKGIENITSKTDGVVFDEKGQEINIRGGRTGKNKIIIDGEEEVNYVEAETRSDFRDAILWMPSVKTDENGNAQVKVKFPDNLTTWRLTVRVLTAQTEVGQNTQSLISRKDLIIRVETPRFFQQNDIVTISTILHNYLNEDKQTKVTFNLDNAMLVNPFSNEQVITLLKNEEKRIDWTVKIDKPIGSAKVFASALTNEESDAMEQKLPIHPFGLKIENNSVYNLTSGSVSKTFTIPQSSDVRSSGLSLGISPSLASTVISSLDGLIGYPYGCVEQTMSRFMPTVITSSVLKELGAPADPYFDEQIPKMVNKGFNKLISLQHTDGGWGWWQNDNSNPFMTAYVVYGLTLAKQNGYVNKKLKTKNALDILKKSVKNKKEDVSTRAYLTWVLAAADSGSYDIVKKQINLLGKKELNDISKAFLSLAAGTIGDKETQEEFISGLMRNANRNDEGSFWGGKVFKYRWQEDNVQATAMVLKALMANDESRKSNKDVIKSGISWLISKRKGTMWGNTIQTAYAVYAIADYIRLNRETETDYSLKVWVNNKNVLEKQVTKEDIFKPEIQISITGAMLSTGENNIRIEKSGTGMAYITQQVIYYESESKKIVEQSDNGFDIEREYYELERKFDKKSEELYYQKKKYEGTIKSGSEMFVKVMVTPRTDNADYFMLEEPIPAGCEVVKEDWAFPIKNETYYKGDNTGSWRWWYSDKDIRDNRIVFFATRLNNRQTYEFTYLLRAQIPGTFNVMPSRGVLMYYPEVNGSSENMIIKIVD